ncbi:MAG: NAD(P)H-hydrate epimerase [Candidatus Marinimicrobia bacterium]|nr:NAD(P)H-hydrate epimerase [Candidatus Neomarinimicrobiota bacterium]
MKRIVTAESARAIDYDAIKIKGISGTKLMLAAGTAVAVATHKLCKEHNIQHVQIFCGKGNNGGDGFVTAIKLKEMLLKNIEVFCFAKEHEIKGDALHFYKAIRSMEISIHFIHHDHELSSLLRDNSCWVDAIFGTGLDRPVEGYFKELMQCLKDLHKQQPVIAIDIPSGLSGNSGKLLGPALKAIQTLTMGFYKSGNFYKMPSLTQDN